MTVSMAATSCPLCGAADVDLVFDGPSPDFGAQVIGSSRRSAQPGQILRCRRCDFHFSRLRPSEEELAEWYGAMDITAYEAERAGRERTAQRLMRFVNRVMPEPGRILDVGCASGAFLRLTIERGWRAFGVEPSSALAESAKRATGGRADIQCCTFRDAHFDHGSFDAITLWDVLEHVPDPISFARACRQLLKADGILFINVPAIDSHMARLLGERWPLLLPEHLNYFSRRSLQRCARTAGFNAVQFSSRMASFSVGYAARRLAQHDVPLARHVATWLERSPLSKVVVSLPLGESLSAWRAALHEER